MGILDHTRHSFTVIVPYLFLDKNGEKKFICNLVKGTDESSGKDARQETAGFSKACAAIISSTSPAMRGNDDMGRFLERVVQNRQYPVSKRGIFCKYPTNRESVSFAGTVKETGEKFFYRIYDLELFHYLLYKLRSIRMEKKEVQA